MAFDLDSLHREFNRLAEETWKKVEYTGWGPTSFSETSLTDHNLYVLATTFPDLNVRQFTQNQEATVGADWEWWVGSDSEGWVCLRVQAKRARGASYPELAHPGAANTFQYDVLIAGCNPLLSEFPLHVFYNGWSEGTFAPGTYWAEPASWLACPGGRRADKCVHAIPRHYGCAVASSIKVKRAHERGARLDRRITTHLANALPWSYLWGLYKPLAITGASHEVRPLSPGKGWLQRLEQTLRQLFTISSDDEPSEDEIAFSSALRPDSHRRLHERLPYHAELVRSGPRGQLPVQDAAAPAPYIIVTDFTRSSEDRTDWL